MKAGARAAAEVRADAIAAAQDYIGTVFEELQALLEAWRVETAEQKDSTFTSVTAAFNEAVNKLAALESIVQARIVALRFVTSASIASAGANVGAASGAKVDAAAGGEEGAIAGGGAGNAVAFDKKKVDRFLKGVVGAVRDFCDGGATERTDDATERTDDNTDDKVRPLTTNDKARLLNAISSAAMFQVEVLQKLPS